MSVDNYTERVQSAFRFAHGIDVILATSFVHWVVESASSGSDNIGIAMSRNFSKHGLISPTLDWLQDILQNVILGLNST